MEKENDRLVKVISGVKKRIAESEKSDFSINVNDSGRTILSAKINVPNETNNPYGDHNSDNYYYRDTSRAIDDIFKMSQNFRMKVEKDSERIQCKGKLLNAIDKMASSLVLGNVVVLSMSKNDDDVDIKVTSYKKDYTESDD